ncbi:MAG: carboxylesterase family protein [Clostridia bacterium]|nr:carboxylesterase family protein [Clostridia bacterium]
MKVKSIYRTKAQWQKRHVVPEIGTNEELKKIPSKRPVAYCKNGVFVGNLEDDVNVWKGVPYAEQPVGELRFAKAQEPKRSYRIFDATYFGKSCLQNFDEFELASQYAQGEDCLCLNVWNNAKNKNKKKPVLVYIHGGGWITGGTSDPLYDGFNFAHYNPDVIVVTITYRFGLMGLINLSSFEGGKKYSTSVSNAILDQIQALRWINKNIKYFGGNPKNVTICGESAGGGSVSILCTIKEARKYFCKAIPMSGGCNQLNTMEQSKVLPNAIRNPEVAVDGKTQAMRNATSVKDLQKVPFEQWSNWWNKNYSVIHNLVVGDGKVVPKDPYRQWRNGNISDITVMQGHTSNEFEYYLSLFGFNEPFFDTLCKVCSEMVAKSGNRKYKKAYAEYIEEVKKLGYSTEKELNREYMDDYSLCSGNIYQAYTHSKCGGKEFCYIFDKSYDGELARIGAAHAVDCFYLFGNFDGKCAYGDKEEVELSRKFQEMIAAFCKSGDPSIENLKWKPYNIKKGYQMIINDKTHLEKGYQLAKTKAIIKMVESNAKYRYILNFADLIPATQKAMEEQQK